MEPISIYTETSHYPIYFETSFESLPCAIEAAGLKNRKVCLITDSQVAPLYLKKAMDALAPVAGHLATLQFSAGEANKHLGTVTRFYDAFLANKLDRSSVVAALGGGVTGDMAGFAAATYMRGIPFVQIPTTLLAQVDAGVGGKTGVDHQGVKNLVGAFYQPRFVYMNLTTLQTLSEDDFRSGLGEVVKHGLIGEETYFRFILAHKQAIVARDADILREVVAGSCRIKASVVRRDEKEGASGIRETLNLGHTFGHAIESLTGFTIPHGACVGIGLCAALFLSCQLGYINKTLMEDTEALLTYFGLPVRVQGLKPEMIYNKMFEDKKTKNNTLRLVLLRGQGDAYTEEKVSQARLTEAINYVTGDAGI